MSQISEVTEEYVNPSIGRIGEMYYDEHNNRIKFFSTDVHLSGESIDILMGRALRMMGQESATRIAARFFTRCGYNQNAEAIIPLNNGFSGIELVFVGINNEGRQSSAEICAEEDALLELLNQSPSSSGIPQGYSIHRLTLQDTAPEDINSMAELYREAFTTYITELDESAISAMIENSVVYAVRDSEKRIVSTVVAEIGSLQTSEGDFRICELSEMATRRSHRGQGLVSAAARALIEDIRDEVDLIYAEARACHMPINQAFLNLGFQYAGRLNKQCILSGDSEIQEEGPYENLNVWYILPHEVGG